MTMQSLVGAVEQQSIVYSSLEAREARLGLGWVPHEIHHYSSRASRNERQYSLPHCARVIKAANLSSLLPEGQLLP